MQKFRSKSEWWIRCAAFAGAALLLTRGGLRVSAAASDVVLYASDVTNVQGNWAKWSGGDAAGGQYMASVDAGWSALNSPLQYPGDYFEASFNADASTPFHVWLRLRAGSNSKWNDSVWVQFSDAVDQNGSPIYGIGSTSGLLVNLEPCSNCGTGNWGWMDGAYWLSQLTSVRFASSGGHTVRVQTREDGAQIDQIVLSPSNYLYNPPGSNSGDSTILSETTGTVSSAVSTVASSGGSSSTSSGGLSPLRGSPVTLPTKIEAEDFDNGGEGVAYHDSSRGNTGGQYRQTDVDIEPSSNGGYDVGWTTPGEWLNYTVNVPAAGAYVVWLRVAAPAGASFHIGFNSGSNVWKTVGVPGTGGWQNWTVVQTSVTLGAGIQQLTLYFDTGGMNIDDFTVGSASGGSAPAAPAAPSGGGGGGGGTVLPVIEWNIQVNDASESHARQAMDVLMSTSPQPQVVVIVEAWQFLFNAYIDELQRQTGKTWYGAFGTHCAAGTWNGGGCANWSQGVGIFSTYPIAGTNTTYFPYADCWTAARVGLRAGINVNGTIVNVFAMHLQTGSCANDMQSRNNSMRDFKAWASNFSQPQLVAGDFNADPDQIDAGSGMAPNFVDSWFAVGSGSRFTAFNPNPSMKLDYWLSDSGGRAQPIQSAVLNSQGVSDHSPLQASFVIR